MQATRDAREALSRLQAAAEDGRLQAVADTHGVTMLVVFGSAVSPDSDPSDLDIAIDHDGSVDVLSFTEALYGLTVFEGIDVLDLRHAGIVASAEALGYGRPLLEVPEGLFAERQLVALAILWDTRWMRDIQLELLAR